MSKHRNGLAVREWIVPGFIGVSFAPVAVLAQASPFETGATATLAFALSIAAPIAALIVIGTCIAAAISVISWGAVFRTIVGIAGVFGAVQIVTWIRSMFGV